MKKIFSKSLQKVCNYKNRVYICSCQTETIMKELILFKSEFAAFNRARKVMLTPLKAVKVRTDEKFIYIEFEEISITQSFCLGRFMEIYK
jgi:Iap family predicted aminopeptidase